MIILPQPPLLRGTPEEQIRQQQKFIIELSDMLSVYLNNIPFDSLDEKTRNLIKGG